MQLVDDRPTAVNYGAPAAGHGEAQVLATLKDIEDALAGGSYIGDGEDVLKAAIGLLDCVAAYNNAEMMWRYAKETDGDEAVFDTCIASVADEFLFFAAQAYPLSYAKMEDGDRDALSEAVIKMITESGQVGRDDSDDEYSEDDDDQPRKKRTKVARPPPKPKRKTTNRRKR